MKFSQKKETRQLTILLICLLVCYSSVAAIRESSVTIASDDVTDKNISVFRGRFIEHNRLYNWMWGEHYRKLYYQPVSAEVISLDTYHGGLSFYKNFKGWDGFLFRNTATNQYYLLKTLDAPTSFLQSSFFRRIYNPKLFHDTYLGNFIKEAVTIENPFSFLLAANLAKAIELDENETDLYHLVQERGDTIFNGVSINNKLINLSRFPDLDSCNIIVGVDSMLQLIHDNKGVVNETMYIRSRVFDMLVGDWNKIPENWMWVNPFDSISKTDSIYIPTVLDRSQAFNKVDGVFLKRLINMLGLSFIKDYKPRIGNVSTFNKLGYPLDLALTANSKEQDWQEQVAYIQNQLTDSCIDSVFNSLPMELHTSVFDEIKYTLKARRELLGKIVSTYYNKLQKNPIITGTNDDESFIINNDSVNNLHIQIYGNDNVKKFDKIYSSKQSKEIWLYPLKGNNEIVIDKHKKPISLTVIGGQGDNRYNIINAKGVKIYTRKKKEQKIDLLGQAKVIEIKDDSILDYDYSKYKYTKFSIMPIGIYDSDLGFNIGSSISYTIYDFKRFPFTQQHQLSFDYSKGFTYQGIFPTYNPQKSFHLLAFLSSPWYFYNFFGFGNQTDDFSDEKKQYNRVDMDKLLITPAYYYQLDKYQRINIDASFQSYKVNSPKGNNRYINTVYNLENNIFKRQNYIDLSLTYSFKKNINAFITDFMVDAQGGWNISLNDLAKNYSYLGADVGFNLNLTNRLVFATEMRGKVLFTDKYTFYQAVTTELRGFRQNRFIGKQSFYQYTDLRLDMGRLNNPFTPLSYGLFVGVDHGRVWYPEEDSKKWHVSYGGGFWLTIFRNMTGKFSYFAATDESRFLFELGMSF